MSSSLTIDGLDRFNVDLDKNQRVAMATALLAWLERAEKKSLPDLDVRLRDYSVRLNRLAHSLSMSVVGTKIVCAVPNDLRDTYRELVYGSSWCASMPSVELALYAAAHS